MSDPVGPLDKCALQSLSLIEIVNQNHNRDSTPGHNHVLLAQDQRHADALQHWTTMFDRVLSNAGRVACWVSAFCFLLLTLPQVLFQLICAARWIAGGILPNQGAGGVRVVAAVLLIGSLRMFGAALMIVDRWLANGCPVDDNEWLEDGSDR